MSCTMLKINLPIRRHRMSKTSLQEHPMSKENAPDFRQTFVLFTENKEYEGERLPFTPAFFLLEVAEYFVSCTVSTLQSFVKEIRRTSLYAKLCTDIQRCASTFVHSRFVASSSPLLLPHGLFSSPLDDAVATQETQVVFLLGCSRVSEGVQTMVATMGRVGPVTRGKMLPVNLTHVTLTVNQYIARLYTV